MNNNSILCTVRYSWYFKYFMADGGIQGQFFASAEHIFLDLNRERKNLLKRNEFWIIFHRFMTYLRKIVRYFLEIFAINKVHVSCQHILKAIFT